MNNRIFIIIFVVVVFIFGGVLYIYNPFPVEYKNPKDEIVACPEDAKLCPDGSYVGRSGPNCIFLCPAEACEGGDPCPIPPGTIFEDGTLPENPAPSNPSGPESPVACTMDVKQCPDGSYVGRTGPNCEFEKCPEVQSL